MDSQSGFSADQATRAKNDGMYKAANTRNELLTLARKIARELASNREDRKLSADDIGRAMKRLGIKESLGPAAGSIFRGKEWQWTGEWIASKRISNHGRMIRVWQLVE